MLKPNTNSELAEEIVRDMTSAPPAVAIPAMEDYLNEAGTLAPFRAPVCLINADLWPTDLEVWRRSKADFSLAVMPGVGHFVMLEDPEEFNRLLAHAVRDLPFAQPIDATMRGNHDPRLSLSARIPSPPQSPRDPLAMKNPWLHTCTSVTLASGLPLHPGEPCSPG